ncbi:phage tail protein [Aggregatibacter segnis]|uniref:phage tail protein n=1 Tax=Aggregatibacter segnis TaxID=739 RepID=UPI00069F01EE|nr:phage tail protein [Aggregatibacter segnis]
MANLKEQEKWEDGVYQIEENDPVLGGENGITNKPIKQLANRTLWLKKALELFGKKSAPKDLTVESTSTADESGHSHKLPVGSTTEKGIWQATSDTGIDSDGLVLTAKAGKKLAQSIAQLLLNVTQNYINNNKKSDAVNSNSSESVASSKAVKTAYDKAVEAKTAADNANQNAEGRVPKTGDTTINGTLRAKNTSGGWSAYQFETSQGFWQLEVHPNSHEEANRRFNMMFIPNIGNSVYLSFPALGNNGEVVAYQSWAVNKAGDSMTGILRTVGIASTHFGAGAYSNQYTSGAPFMVEATGSKDRDTYHPFVKGLVRSKGRFGAGFSLGYTTKQGAGDGFGRGIIHLVEDNGSNKTWSFEHNGDFVSPNDVLSSSGRSINKSIQQDEVVGEVAYFARTTPPSGWLKANGAAVSRTTYAALFAAIGTTFGAGDGRTTFNLPDLRGEFIRGLDDGRNIDRGRRLGTAQGDAIRNITGKLDGSAMGSGNQVLEGKMIASGAIGTTYQQRQWSGDQGGWGEQSVSFDFDASRVVPTANENRPRNVALLACIKY